MAISVKDSNSGKRRRGSFNLPGNFEVKIEGPLDTRMVVGSITDLLDTVNIENEPKYQYYGMLVVVSGDDNPENDGLYRLLEDGDPTDISAWEKIGSGSSGPSDDLITHTGDTNNPHKTSFSNLTSTAHTHTIADITDLQTQLEDKLNTSDFDAYSGNVQTQLSGKLDNSDFTSHTGDTTIHYTKDSINLSDLGSTAHTHSITDITDLQSELDSKLNTSDFDTYSGSVKTQLDSKLDIDTFVEYTGSVKDVHVTSGSVNAQDQSITFTDTSGGTFDLENAASLFTDTDSYVTGGTYNPNTGVVTYKTSSGYTFEVTGFTTGMTDTYVTNGTLEGTTLKLTKSDGGAVSDIELSGLKVWDKNNTNAYYNTGNVGIGTNNPLSPLHLEGSDFDNSSIRFLNKANDNNENYWLIGSRSFGGSNLDGFEIGRVGDSTGGKLYLRHDGNVGIGTYQPSQKLDVNGVTKSDVFAVNNGANTRIISPEGAEYEDVNNKLGRIKITAPANISSSSQATQFKSTIKVFYSGGLFDLHISCYIQNNGSSTKPMVWEYAYIDSPPDGNNKYNFKVNLYFDENNKFAISIGEHDSSWGFLKVVVTDVILGFNNDSIDDWSTGWSIDLDTNEVISTNNITPIKTISATQANNWGKVGNSLKYEGGDVNISNGRLIINGYIFPTSKGTDGQVLKTDGSGTLTWQDDTNTSIWTELNSNIYYNTGNVGIGTTVPLEKLHVSTGDNEDSGNISFLIGGTAGTNARTGRIIKNTSSPYEMTIRASDFDTGNNLILNDTGGNVGIGTDTPDGPLHVETPTGVATIRVKSSGNTSSAFHAINKDGAGITLGINGSRLKLNNTGSLNNNHLVIDSSGNVGINTDSPTQKLEVAGSILADSLSTTWSTGRAGNTRILSPGGGSYSVDGGTTGAFIITLPQGGSNTMISMSVKIFDYTKNEHITLNIAGYAIPISHSQFTSAWTRQSAWIEGNPKDEHNFKVRFTYDLENDKNVIIIGETDSHWDYPDINIIDVQVGYDDSTPDKWNDGWKIELSTDWDTIMYVDGETNESKRKYVEPDAEDGIIENTQAHNWIRNTDNSIIYNQGTVNIGVRSISENNIKLFATSDNIDTTINNNAIPITGISGSTHTALGYGTSTSNSYGIAMGTLASSGKSWIQGKRFKGEGPQVYSLLLNPLGGNVGIGTETPNQKLEVAGGIKVSDTSNSLTINNYTLPAADGGVGQVLKTDGSGNVSWQNDTDTNTSIWTENAGTNTATYDGHIVVDSLSTIWQNPNTTSRDNTRILNPKGGSFSNEIGAGDARNSKGSIIITLPQGKTSTMLSMTVKIFDYAFNEHLILNVSGYLFGGASHGWNNGSVWIDNNPKYSHNLTVWLGYDAELGKNVVIIGEPDTTWGNFLDVNVMDVQAQHHNEEVGNWNDGWNIKLSEDWDIATYGEGSPKYITNNTTNGSTASKFIHTQVNNWIRNTDNSIKYESGDVQILGTNNSLTINDYTLPAADGESGQVLKTNGSGVVTWQNDTDTNTSIWTENTSYTRDADNTNISGAYYNTGFVGIGNNMPQSKLHLEGSNFTDSAIRFLNKANTTNNPDYWMIGSRAFSSGADGFEIGRNFGVTGGDTTGGKLYITNDGDVSIGNGYLPTNKLEVNGNIFIDETSSSLKINDYTLPAADGTDGQVLKTDGNGNTTWGYYGLKLVSVNVKDVLGDYNLSENTFTKVLTYENDSLAGNTYNFILPVISTESKGNEVVVKHVGGKQTIAIVAPGVTKIDNHYSSVNITNGDSITFYCDGFDWYIKSHYKNVFGTLPGFFIDFSDENNSNTSPTAFDPNIYFASPNLSTIVTEVEIGGNSQEVYVHTTNDYRSANQKADDGVAGPNWYITEVTGDVSASSSSGRDGEKILISQIGDGDDGTISFATGNGKASTLTVTTVR